MEVSITCGHCGHERTRVLADSVTTIALDSCPVCAAERARLRARFGKTDLDGLAKSIYGAYHGGTLGDPWTTYEVSDDGVVEDFRDAAEAATQVIRQARWYK